MLIALAVLTASAAPHSPTPLRFGATLGNSMVLELPAVIWGWGTPGEEVVTKVSPAAPFGALRATVGPDGLWRQPLPAIASAALGGLSAYTVTSQASSGGPAITLTGVLFGRVVMCSGQSNIDTITVEHALNASAEIAAAPAFTHVRLFRVAQDSSDSKEPDLRAPPATAWGPPTNASVPGFSATCWFVARNLFVELGGLTPVGVVQSASGGTAVRNWAPVDALARCPQPYNSPDRYGTHPYMHAVLYNAMVHPFSTAPTSFSFVVWDQAESDSVPQTPLGYYGCQTVAQVNAWRKAFAAPALPWVFVHLQPYTGSGPCCLADLRAMQLQALGLPQVGYASAVDLGDPTSPFGNVHFQNKQVVSRRLVAVAMQLAFGRPRAPAGDGAWPPPGFLTQTVNTTSTRLVATVTLADEHGAPFRLAFGATVDMKNQSSAVCPPTVNTTNCSAFEILTSDGEWREASAAVTADGTGVVLTSPLPVPVGKSGTPYAVGSRYAWGAWPLATLFAAGEGGALGLPVLPWQQAVTMAAPNGGSLAT